MILKDIIVTSDSRSYITFSTDTSASAPSIKSPDISNEINEQSKHVVASVLIDVRNTVEDRTIESEALPTLRTILDMSCSTVSDVIPDLTKVTRKKYMKINFNVSILIKILYNSCVHMEQNSFIPKTAPSKENFTGIVISGTSKLGWEIKFDLFTTQDKDLQIIHGIKKIT